MLLIEDDTVLASLDILFKEIAHAGRRYSACGLCTVVTRQELRGRGHGRRLVVAAREAIPALGVDLALFTCDRALQRFYECAGFELLAGAVLIGGTADEPFPSDQPGFDKVTLGAFLSPAARAGRASFEHARIELYPGEIDKLW
jgi:aminoglycoside 2'-N-acetyltransferase I